MIKGTYAYVKFHRGTNKAIHKYIQDAKLPNAVRPDQLHTTLLYSRKHLPEYEPQGLLMMAHYGIPQELAVWETQSGERCLVLKFSCAALVRRHKYLMDKHQAMYDFPEYVPHVTLSYDIGDMDHTTLPDITEYLNEGICLGTLVIVEEVGRDLVEDWVVKNVLINKQYDLGQDAFLL